MHSVHKTQHYFPCRRNLANQSLTERGSIMPNPLDPNTIPKFVNQLVVPPIYEPTVVKDPNTYKSIQSFACEPVNELDSSLVLELSW